MCARADLKVRLIERLNAPSLTWATLVTSHMAPPAVQACMVDLSPLSLFLLLSTVVFVVVASSSVWGVGTAGSRTRIRRGVGVSRIVYVRGHWLSGSGTLGASMGSCRRESVSQVDEVEIQEPFFRPGRILSARARHCIPRSSRTKLDMYTSNIPMLRLAILTNIWVRKVLYK